MPFELAQLNIAKMKEPLDSPLMADFVANLGRINALAEQSPGFVWRLQDESGDATSIRPFGTDIVVNLSVWKDVASLHAYTFRSAHVEILKRRREWFDPMSEAHAVLWWVSRGHRPTTEEAARRLQHLQHFGPGEQAFTFKDAFPPPGMAAPVDAISFNNECPA